MRLKIQCDWLRLAKTIVLATVMSMSPTTFARDAFSLVEGSNGNGLWLSALVWQENGIPDDTAVKNAVEANTKMVAVSDVSQLSPAMIAGGTSGKDLSKTPALLPIDASNVDYKAFWRWGNKVLLDVNYRLPKRLVPWRSDYRCGQPPGCQLLTQPHPQFFELSYFQYKQNEAKTIPLAAFAKQSSAQTVYNVRWPDPDSRPDYSGREAASDSTDLQWKLKINPLNAALDWKNGEIIMQGEPDNPGPAVVRLFTSTLNKLLAKSRFDRALKEDSGPTEQYVEPIANNGYGYFVRYVDSQNGMQKSKRLVYQEQLIDMISSWQQIDIVGNLELANRGFLFIQPTVLTELGDKTVLQKSAVTVFEYRLGGPLELQLGVKADWIGALLSNDYLLEAIRVQS